MSIANRFLFLTILLICLAVLPVAAIIQTTQTDLGTELDAYLLRLTEYGFYRAVLVEKDV